MHNNIVTKKKLINIKKYILQILFKYYTAVLVKFVHKMFYLITK